MARIGKHFSDSLHIEYCLMLNDALSPLLLTFVLKYIIGISEKGKWV
jgi:hypothetical protein